MEDKDWRVDMNSFQDDGKEIQLRMNVFMLDRAITIAQNMMLKAGISTIHLIWLAF